jgi:nucleotide-binding universal stress UspA family protein
MYTDILLPTDDSPGVTDAIEHSIDIAKQYDGTLHVLYVVDEETYSSYSGDEYVHEFEGLEHALQETGEEALESIAELAREEDVHVETVMRHGVPHEEILAYADEVDVDLTVLGSKHRPGEYRRLLGSVAERVARMGERPVSIVKTDVSED